MYIVNKQFFALIIILPSLSYGQLKKRECTNYIKKINQIRYEYDSLKYYVKYKSHDDSVKLKKLKRLYDSTEYIHYWFRYAPSDIYQKHVIDSNGWLLPDSIAKDTRFGNLKNGQSLNFYYMKPLVVFYDSTWEQTIYFDMGDRPIVHPRGFRTLGPCRDSMPNTKYTFYHTSEACQCDQFYRRLAFTYDLPFETIKKLAVKGRDMRYFMYRRIEITKLECYYEVKFYKELFTSDTGVTMLNWFYNKYKNKDNNGFTPVWEVSYIQNSTLNYNPMVNQRFITSELDMYSELICEMEKWKKGFKKFDIKSKYLNEPTLDKLWIKK